MGCTMFTGLTGNFALPRQTGAATATWNTETNDPARSGHGSPVPEFQEILFLIRFHSLGECLSPRQFVVWRRTESYRVLDFKVK